MHCLSKEAKVCVGAWWSVMMTGELKFQRPHIIHPRTRKGLDELVDKGFLTVEKFNDISDALVWKPTDKMRDKSQRPKVSMDFVKEHGFPITTE